MAGQALGGNEDAGQSPGAESPHKETSVWCWRSTWCPPVPVAIASSPFHGLLPPEGSHQRSIENFVRGPGHGAGNGQTLPPHLRALKPADRFQILRLMPARRGRQALQCVHSLISD